MKTKMEFHIKKSGFSLKFWFKVQKSAHRGHSIDNSKRDFRLQ